MIAADRSRPVYLKLGGALLTDKKTRETHRPDVLARLAGEIADWAQSSDRPLVLAHGSGSFAHMAVRDTGFLTRPDSAVALASVAAAARRLSSLVVESLLAAGLPALPVPGSLLAECRDGQVDAVRADIVSGALRARLVPVLYGDAAPDTVRGGCIASTEPLFVALARVIPPSRVVLATDVDGVYASDPRSSPGQVPIARLEASDALRDYAPAHASDRAVDFTGGMGSKVRLMAELAESTPGCEVRILSGLRPGAIGKALDGSPEAGGTVIQSGAPG
ncbi:MAG: isopentenyl phosphate kinase [Anaerolineae bacterium]